MLRNRSIHQASYTHHTYTLYMRIWVISRLQKGYLSLLICNEDYFLSKMLFVLLEEITTFSNLSPARKERKVGDH